MEGDAGSPTNEFDHSQGTAMEVTEFTLESTPKRSSSTPLVVNKSPSSSSKRSSKSTVAARSPKEDQQVDSIENWVFPIPATTPKKFAGATPKKLNKTPDSISKGSPSLSLTPQKDFGGSLPGTPSNISGSNSSPISSIEALKWSDISPYKSTRPKYLPKNIKLLKKKQQQRRKNLQNLVKVNDQLLQTTRTFSNKTPKIDRLMNTSLVSDPLGTVLPRSNVFAPLCYFIIFNEYSLNVNDFVSTESLFANKKGTEIIDGLRNRSLLITSTSELRFCSHLLTVTTHPCEFDFMFSLIKMHIGNSYCISWIDLKEVLMNFGLTLDRSKYSPSTLTPPQQWNVEFLLFLIDKSFHSFPKSCNRRLLSLLVDSLFEKILLKSHHSVIKLIQRVSEHLLNKKVSIGDMIILVNRSYLSTTHNRFIFQYLASASKLVPLARALGIHTVYNIARVTDDIPLDLTTSQILSFLNKKYDIIVTVSTVHIHQLLLICEKLFLLSGFDPLSIEKLALFARRIGMTYSHFDKLNLNVIVNRLEALAACPSL